MKYLIIVMIIFVLLDYVGILVFVIFGVLVVMCYCFDFFGVFILVIVMVVGGGSLCDVVIGWMFVGWM